MEHALAEGRAGCEGVVDVKHSLLSAFLGKPIAPLQAENVTRDQDKGTVYEHFRRTIRLPEEYVARMRDSRYYRHFYGSE